MTHYPTLRHGALAMALMAILTTAAAAAAPSATANQRPGGKKDEGWQIEQRKKWFIQTRGLDRLPDADQHRRRALQQMKVQSRSRVAANRAAGEEWTPIGPAAMKMGQWVMGPVSGRLTAVVPHPSDENTLYVGTANGGVWKTTNAGASWAPLFDEVGTQPIGSIYIEPNAPQNVWVGTGDRNGVCNGYHGEGVYHSADGGATWTQKNGTASNLMALGTISALVRHPTNTNLFLAAGTGGYGCGGEGFGIYRSTDRGATWSRVSDKGIEDVVFVPGTNTVYAAGYDGVFKSTDSGATWTSIGGSVVQPNGRARLAIAPSDPNTIYVLAMDDLYRSTNGGVSWTKRNDAPCEGQCWYDLTLAVHPTNPNELLIGSIRFARSTDGGTTLNYLTDTWGSTQKVHQDTHVLRYSTSNPNRYWVGTDGGLWRTDDGGTNWVNMNSNLNITQFYDVTPHPDNADVVYGGAQDNSSSRRTTSNEWDLSIVTGDGFVNVVDSTNPNIVFQTSYPWDGYARVVRSTQGGAEGTFEWLPLTGLDQGGWAWKTTMAHAGSHIFIASNRIYRALTSASPFAWTSISNAFEGGVSALTPLRTADGKTPAYAGTTDGKVYSTLDASAASVTWSNVSGSLPAYQVSDIAIDPTNRQRVFVLFGPAGTAGLYRSTTGGGTWQSVGAGLPPMVSMQAVAIDPLNVNRIFVGTDIGVYESTDGGANFVPFVAGYPLGAQVQDLEIDNDPHVLIAGTYGRGAWKVPLQSSGNQAPVAGFSHTANGLTVNFTDASTDADGTVASRHWNFGDGTSSTATNPSKTFAAAGNYTVTLTVTDNGGAVDTETKTITVGSSGNTLTNGVPVTGLSAATGGEVRYTMAVPANATGLKFTTVGSNGDADLYVRFGSPPTTSSYTCRSAGATSNETCNIATAQAGTYHVLVRAYTAFSGLSLTGQYTVSQGQTYTNGTDVGIADYATVESPITVSGRSGNAPSTAQVAVKIVHTYIGDLKVDLVAPDGSVYVLHNRTGTSTDNIDKTYTVNLSSEPLNGTWKLRVNDNGPGDTGLIDTWSITF